MHKTEALQLLGGTASEAAKLIGVTPQAISGWPEELTPALRDRVQAALFRMKHAQDVAKATKTARARPQRVR